MALLLARSFVFSFVGYHFALTMLQKIIAYTIFQVDGDAKHL